MKTIVVKVDDETYRQLKETAGEESRSEIVRAALRDYLAKQRIGKRRREVEEYMRLSGERTAMKRLAEADMDHAAELLERVETER